MKILLAPMEGVVDHHLRKIYASLGGIDGCVTEFIRVTHSRLPEKVFHRYCPELKTPLKVPVKIQLLGSYPSALAYHANKIAAMGATAVDLNFGCPAKTVNKNRGGACLLDEPELIFQIVHAVVNAVPAGFPVSAKIRLGYHDRNSYLQNALAIEAAGASELVVHARSRADGYHPPAYWEYIGAIQSKLRIPIVANGEIWSLNDYLRCRDQSQCVDVMLGRGLLARPDLALAIKAHSAGQAYDPMAWTELAPILLEFQQATLDSYPLKHCGNRLKQWLVYLKRHYPEAQSLFNIIKSSRDPQQIDQAIKDSYCA